MHNLFYNTVKISKIWIKLSIYFFSININCYHYIVQNLFVTYKSHLNYIKCHYSLNISLCFPPPDPIAEYLPTVHGLVGPDPETGGDTNDHTHQVFYHEHFKFGFTIPRYFINRTWDRVLFVLTRFAVPRRHPGVEVGLLVEKTREDDQCWYRVQHWEDSCK